MFCPPYLIPGVQSRLWESGSYNYPFIPSLLLPFILLPGSGLIKHIIIWTISQWNFQFAKCFPCIIVRFSHSKKKTLKTLSSEVCDRVMTTCLLTSRFSLIVLLLVHLIVLKALANEDTMLRTHCCRHKCFPVCPHEQHLLRTQILCPGHKKCIWFCSETFCVRNKCFPVCAAQETSWATMCPQQCVLVCQGLYNERILFFIPQSCLI